MKRTPDPLRDGRIKVEHGIPMPASRSIGRYPWAEMKVGDSFYAPGKKHDQVSGMTSYWSKRLGRKFAARRWDKGVRVWRIK